MSNPIRPVVHAKGTTEDTIISDNRNDSLSFSPQQKLVIGLYLRAVLVPDKPVATYGAEGEEPLDPLWIWLFLNWTWDSSQLSGYCVTRGSTP